MQFFPMQLMLLFFKYICHDLSSIDVAVARWECEQRLGLCAEHSSVLFHVFTPAKQTQVRK